MSGGSDLAAAQLTLRSLDPASLTPEERLMLNRSSDAVWRLRENIYYQYKNGLFDEPEFLAESASWAGSFDTPFGREFFCRTRHFYSPGFVELVEGMLSSTDCPTAE
jgi:hypothetical protein